MCHGVHRQGGIRRQGELIKKYICAYLNRAQFLRSLLFINCKVTIEYKIIKVNFIYSTSKPKMAT